MARLADKPKIVSEYNMEDNGPKYDPFTVAPYISALAAFQGWNAIMDEVISDTGQLRRDWIRGSFIVDTPKTQMVMGGIKNQPLRTADASFSIAVPKAAVALSSLDRQPLRQSKKILVSTIARMAIGTDKQARTEPVAGTIALSSTVKGLRLVPLKSDGSRSSAIPLKARDGTYTIVLPTDKQTHWFVLQE
ncbi:hypothetical protein ACFL5Q_00230 [Planctomycetota bacterium]